MITILLFIISFLLFIFILYSIVEWLTHISMVKDHTDIYGYANYQKFKREFVKQKWNYIWRTGLFNSNTNSKIHAGIIQFNGIGMIINNPVSYFLCMMYVKKHIKPTKGGYKW